LINNLKIVFIKKFDARGKLKEKNKIIVEVEISDQ